MIDMKKVLALIGIFTVLVTGVIAIPFLVMQNSETEFGTEGYVLGIGEDKKLEFNGDTTYKVTVTGSVQFSDIYGKDKKMDETNFIHYDAGQTSALSDGVLLDFADLSSNFINNYYISSGVVIEKAGQNYTTQTDSGSLTFGEHLWKLSPNKFLIQSQSLKVHFSEEDVREVSDFVEVSITDDGIINLLTEDNQWTTISDKCYIETKNNVKIYPVDQIIDDGTYKITVSKLVVSPNDTIVLTSNETRKQIVPELNIEAVDGKDGDSGTDGETGNAGEDGGDGEAGGSGSNGIGGSNGLKGNDAILESSTNSALPVLSITDWHVTGNSLRGMISVSGGIENLEVTATNTDPYKGTVTLTNMNTNEVVSCYEVAEDYKTVGIDKANVTFNGFLQGQDEIYFSTVDNPLKPDTAYKLTVVAYYQMNDMIYSREFITRVFYTDSTGIQLAHISSEEKNGKVNISVADANIANLSVAEVILLTQKENQNFTLSKKDNKDDTYVQKFILSYSNNTISKVDGKGITSNYASNVNNPQILEFESLKENTTYIARVVSMDKNGLNVLTNQELEIQTLKTPPKWDVNDKPDVYYNRVTGSFEVYRPNITDIHGGVKEYIYTIYDSSGEEVMSKTVLPSEGEPVIFYLSSGEDYKAGIKMEFDDNEKMVSYDLGKSNSIKATGDTLPKLILNLNNQYYNNITGNLKINLNSNSSLTVNSSNPLTLDIYADQVINQTIKIEGSTAATVADKYSLTYDGSSTNEKNISLEFENLYKNTNYTITLRGSLDLGDGNGAIERTLGTVSFRTKDVEKITTTWTNQSGASTAISELLKLNVSSSVSSKPGEVEYITNELKSGIVNVQLYKGTNYDRMLIGEVNYIEQNELNQIYGGTGIEITENSFGVSSLQKDVSYMIVVNEVVDATYNMNLGYENEFDSINNSYKVLTAKATPPDLLIEPTNGVLYTPIYNEDAEKYGAKENLDLLEETVIGYLLESTYDNSQRLASSITYYLYEYSEFYNAFLASKNPLNDANSIKEVTLEVKSSVTDEIPKIAVFFDDVDFNETIIEGTTYSNGAYVYKPGTDFSRGYRYAFAYTAEYSATGVASDISSYPYDHSDYTYYMKTFGAGKEGTKAIGKNIAYVLNSGMVEAPREYPLIYSYVNESTGNLVGDDTNGTVTVHYTYKDIDNAITETEGSETNIYFNNLQDIEVSQPIDELPVNGISDWYEVTIPYVVDEGQRKVLTPYINISDYEPNIDYDTILSSLDAEYEAPKFMLAEIPVEFAYGELFNGLKNSSYKDALIISMDENYDQNYIEFNIADNNVGSTSQREMIVNRAYALHLTFTASGAPQRDYYLPINLDVYSESNVIFSTSQLGDQYLNKQFNVSAEIMYDNGIQGWNLVDNTINPLPMFGLQRTSIVENGKLSFEHGGYYVYPESVQDLASGGLLKNRSTFDTEALRNTAINDISYFASFDYMSSSIGFSRYLTVEHFGVNVNSNDDVENLTNLYIVPKGVGVYPISFVAGGNTGTLTSLTPTVGDIHKHTSFSIVKLNNFKIAGKGEIEDNKVNVYVYPDKKSAENLLSNYIDKITFELQSSGNPIMGSSIDNELKNLSGNTEYFLVFTAKVKDKSGAKERIILDTLTNELAIYSFETIDGIRITPDEELGIVYYNLGYFEKYVQMKYTLNQYLGINIEYDIYKTHSAADKDLVPYLSHKDLINLNLISEPSIVNVNEFYMNLTPDIIRKKLMPGETYYLKITATPKGTTTETYVIEEFKLGDYEIPGALVYANNATSNSVSFQVTINDTQYSLMADKNESKKGSIYSVRFTDNNNKRIYTVYDDVSYNSSSIQQTFVLDENNCIGSSDNYNFIENTPYNIHIYAVPDVDHNGLSEKTANSANSEKTWESFFKNKQIRKDKNGNDVINYNDFNDYVSEFWENVGVDTGDNDPSLDNVETNFLIASRGQQTTDSNNILINEDMATVSLNNNSFIELILAESYGVTKIEPITGNEEQSFEKINYSISGYTINGMPVNYFGISDLANGDTLFKKGKDSAKYDVFSYVIPQEIEKGTYNITISLYETSASITPYKKLSFTYRS